MTYNQFVSLIESFADDHIQINRFGVGSWKKVEAQLGTSANYPFLWMVPKDCEVRTNSIALTVGFTVFDILKEDNSNEQDILSDTLSISADLVKWLRNEDTDGADLTVNPRLRPFTDRLSEFVAGWEFDAVVELDWNGSVCDIPFASGL